MFQRSVAILLLIQFAFVNYSQQQYNNQPVSPCPHVFEYRHDGTDWFGLLTTNAPRLDQKEAVLQLTLSLRAATTVCGMDLVLVGFSPVHYFFIFFIF